MVVLGLLLVLVFLTGGSSRYDVPQLVVLRPLAICAAGFALVSFSASHWRAYRPLWLLCAAVLLLTSAHLIPLPPEIWRSLPGREIVAEIDTVAGLSEQWRPLSLFPEGTWNALFALSVPLGALLLAAQLDERDLMRVLVLIVGLCLVSGLIGVLQAAGSDLRFYRITGGAGGLLANRNHQAALLACVLPMLAAWALSGERVGRTARARHIVAGAIAVTLVPLIMVTGSRMGLALAALALVYSGLMVLRQRHGASASRYARLAQGAIGLFAVIGMVAATVLVSRDVAFDRLTDAGDEARWPIWDSIIGFLPHYLPWGSGIGSFVPVYQIHEGTDMLMPRYTNQAHNDWLDVALTSGIPGILIGLAALVMIGVAARRAMSAPGTAGQLRRAGVGIIVVLAFASLSDYPVRTPILSVLLAIAAIWACAPPSRHKLSESKRLDAKA